jgi:hypothetical protein
MAVRYIEPLGRAWTRMKLALLKPFDLHKWLVVGFNAFLAGLAEGHGASGGFRGGRGRAFGGFGELLSFPGRAWGWMLDHPGWFIAILFAAAFFLALILVLLWLSSRGKFMFLDNVVQSRAEVARPWKEYVREGDSLFLWRLVFSFVVLVGLAAFGVAFFVLGRRLYEPERIVPVLFLVGWSLTLFAYFVVVGYISLYLEAFVVPLMYKNRCGAVSGWSRFLKLWGRHPGPFILYGILLFGLYLLFGIMVVLAGLFTCCLGWLILVIPYIGTVVTLPFWFTLRSFSLEFLGQFGPDYALFPEPQAPLPSASSPA